MLEFYRNKRVLVTGHTGFKGSWLCRVLALSGAEVCGYSLMPPTTPSLFEAAGIEDSMRSVIGDIRDREHLAAVFSDFAPEIVIHMAAQPIVRESYKNPVYTFETNIMGTVNVCECVRQAPSVKSFVNVTTDKVYENRERPDEGYREDEPLDGYDPYSNSKSCSELVTHSYVRSFFREQGIAASTARAGNVIGGGDFAADRIIPDCVRAAAAGRTIIVRNPNSVRPYQHVLEPVFAYLMIAKEQYNHPASAGWYNVGPRDADCITTGKLAELFVKYWEGSSWTVQGDAGPHEAGFLKLNCDKIEKVFGWRPKWNIETAVRKTAELSKVLFFGTDKAAQKTPTVSADRAAVLECMDRQIREYADV